MRGTTSSALDTLDDAPRYDDTAWPLFSVEMPAQALPPSAFEAYLATCRAVFERGEPFFFLIDLTEHPALLAGQRNEMAEAMQRDCVRHPGVCRALAVVVRSSFERSVAQTIHSMARPSYPFAIFSTVAEAKVWLGSKGMPSEAPDHRLHEIVPPPSRRAQSSAPPYSRTRDSLMPFSRRPLESPLPPSSIRIEAAPLSSHQPRISLAAPSRRPSERG